MFYDRKSDNLIMADNFETCKTHMLAQKPNGNEELALANFKSHKINRNK